MRLVRYTTWDKVRRPVVQAAPKSENLRTLNADFRPQNYLDRYCDCFALVVSRPPNIGAVGTSTWV